MLASYRQPPLRYSSVLLEKATAEPTQIQHFALQILLNWKRWRDKTINTWIRQLQYRLVIEKYVQKVPLEH